MKVEHNRQFLAAVDPLTFPEWASVVAFYTAVHEVERLRAALGHGDSQGHADRRYYVNSYHRSLTGSLNSLQDYSERARYRSRASFFAALDGDPTLVRSLVIDTLLADVSEYVAARVA